MGTFSKSLDRQNELLSSSEEVHGPRKDRGTSEGLHTHFSPRKSPTDKSLRENQSNLSEDQKKIWPKGRRTTAQWKILKTPHQKLPDKGKQAPKSNQNVKQKARGKAKPKWNKPYPQNYRISKKENTAMKNVFYIARNLI
ncbi:hypothetical protein O181_008263 [Austropuccinia psidii MF-1]|uniref:Uncharacterized protein n=1 Tax=Austropuccinia psidii MF-1 TaxID=1389203 RepID=A0A9Q3GIC5_9BASI|nr:hypothetical protein [Austropuccinia psidii MF-1]